MKWETMKMRDVALGIFDGPHATPKESESGPVFLGIRNITEDGHLDFSDIKRISEQEYPTWIKRVKPDEDDIVFTYEATLHRYAMIPKNFIGCLGRRTALVRCNRSIIEPKFLLYTFLSPLWRNYINNHLIIGATVDRISISEFPEYQISVPPLPTQRRIASILSAYDDLIENNLRRIKLLEEAARCEYKMLMEQSENRPRVPIKEVLEYYIGGGWGNQSYSSDFCKPAFVIRGTDIPNNKMGDISNTPYRFHKESNLTNRNLQSGDIVFEVSGGSKTSPIGRALIISDKLLELFHGDVMCASFCKLMRPNDKISPAHLYLFLCESYNDGYLKPYERPSASNIINFGFETYIEEATIIIPDDTTLNDFTITVQNYLQLIAVIGAQNMQLRQARDLLLPKLMSGEIDVSDQVEQAKLIQLPIQVSVAAEDEVVYETKKHKSGAKYYLRTVLAAYIVDTLWQEKTFGHVKLMKLMYLCEHLADIETVSNYHRDAAGPYDNQMIRSIDKQLKDKQWFEMYKNQQGFPKYRPMDKHNNYKVEFEKYYRNKQIGIDSLLARFGKESTERVEMVATTYEAWRYLNSKQSSVNEAEIINEILNNWHDSKKRISEDRWKMCYWWIKDQNWIV